MKGKKLQEGGVIDEKGRRKFHGAFTGGFSAGYYNTVGSEEGWKPTNFISSRNNRAEPIKQSMYNFIDNEDGLLGEILITKEDFDTFGKDFNNKKEKYLKNESYSSAIPGPIPTEMIVSSSNAIGLKLLKQMGWKEGQGIGSRHKRKTRDNKTIGIDIEGLDLQKLPVGTVINGEILLSALDDEPNKLSQIPKPKSDKYGLGYDYSNNIGNLSNNQELITYNKYNSNLIFDTNIGSGIYCIDDINNNSSNNRLFKNNNLAVGKINNKVARDIGGFALNDDDDDVYDNPSTSIDYTKVSTYSQPITKLHNELNLSIQNDNNIPLLITDSAINSTSSISSSSQNNINKTQLRCKTDNKLPLLGFHVSTHTLHCTLIKPSSSSSSTINNKNNNNDSNISVFLPPNVPQDFIERHNFENDRYLINKQNIENNVSNEIIGSESGLPSGKGKIYDMLDIEAKYQINKALISTHNQNYNNPPTILSVPSGISQGLAIALKGRFTSTTTNSTLNSNFQSNSQLQSIPIQSKGGLVTSSELQQERKLREENEKKLIQEDNKKNQSITNKGSRRVTTTWAPNRLLCKRMNVPIPQITTQNITNIQNINHGREAEIFEKHIEKHMTPFINQTQSTSTTSTSTLEDNNKFENHQQQKQQQKQIHEKEEIINSKPFHLEENIDPTTGIFIPEIKPTMSLLKSIFDDSDDDDDDDDDDDSDDSNSEEIINNNNNNNNNEVINNIETKNESSEINENIKEKILNESSSNEINNTIIGNEPVEIESRIVFRRPVSKNISLSSKLNNNISSNSKKRSFKLSFDDGEGEIDGEGDDNNVVNDNDNGNDDINNKINILNKSLNKQEKINSDMSTKFEKRIKHTNDHHIDSKNKLDKLYQDNQTNNQTNNYPREMMKLDTSHTIERLKKSLQLLEENNENSKDSKKHKERKHHDEKKKKKEKKSKKKSKKESKKKKSKKSSSSSSSSTSSSSSH